MLNIIIKLSDVNGKRTHIKWSLSKLCTDQLKGKNVPDGIFCLSALQDSLDKIDMVVYWAVPQLEPQQKYRRGTVSNIIALDGLNQFYEPTL